MTSLKSLPGFLLLSCLCVAATATAKADGVTYTGTFAADNSIATFNLNPNSATDYTFYTTSYGGGANANGMSVSLPGGFVPVLTLFSATTGNVLGFGGGDAMCHGSSSADPSTGLCEDASFSEVLGPGSYVLDLTEFPNVANGNLSDGFLFSGSPNATGDVCGVSGGTFLQSDLAPCVQRNNSYAVNISASPVPEPATWLLVFPPAAALALFGRRQFA
ncbi:MAG: DVUA0089 family protein [Acidobacteriota bacterium]|nr:DVUA0089 family protein [Acidobacteriota bacterium]